MSYTIYLDGHTTTRVLFFQHPSISNQVSKIMSSQLVTSFKSSPAEKGLQIRMWHPPPKSTATSTFRINKVQKKKVPQQDPLKRKLSASVRGIGRVISPSPNEDCFPVSREVAKSALFLSLTSAASSDTSPSMQGVARKLFCAR